MKLNVAISKRLKELLEERGMTQYALFKASGVPQSTISTILKAEIKTIKLKTLYDICAGLNIEFADFFNVNYLKINELID